MCYMNNSTHLRNSPQPSLDEALASIFRKSTRSDGLSSASATFVTPRIVARSRPGRVPCAHSLLMVYPEQSTMSNLP